MFRDVQGMSASVSRYSFHAVAPGTSIFKGEATVNADCANVHIRHLRTREEGISTREEVTPRPGNERTSAQLIPILRLFISPTEDNMAENNSQSIVELFK